MLMCPSSGMQEQIRVLSHPFPEPSRPLSASRDSCLSRHELPAADGVCSFVCSITITAYSATFKPAIQFQPSAKGPSDVQVWSCGSSC